MVETLTSIVRPFEAGVLYVPPNALQSAIPLNVRSVLKVMAYLPWSAGGTTRSRLKTGGGSYLSAHDPRLVLGIGAATQVDWLEVRWPAPSGRVERFTKLPTDRYLNLVEGSGQPAAPRATAR